MKGILFKEPLFNAIIEGRKTQTRRIINPQPTKGFFPSELFINNKSRYKKGDIVYMKEPYIDDLSMDKTFYKYNSADIEELKMSGFDKDINKPKFWKNKLFMPESEARYFIKISNVKIERISDISDHDAIAEGITMNNIPHEGWYWLENVYSTDCPVLAFEKLWDSINNKWSKGKDGIKRKYPFTGQSLEYEGQCEVIANPWVFVYEFKLTDLK